MNADELCQKVKEAAPRSLLHPALGKVLDHMIEEREDRAFYEADVAEAITRAGRYQASSAFKGSAKPGKQRTVIGMVGNEDVIASDQLCFAFQPRIETLRNEVFGSVKIPFKSDKAAVEWLREAEKKDRSLFKALPTEEFHAALRTFHRRFRCGLSLETKTIAFPLKVKDEICLGRVAAVPGGTLWKIQAVLESVAQVGFNPGAVTWWLLRGVEPLLPRASITKHLGLYRSWVTIEVNARKLSWKELHSIYKEVGSMPNVAKRKVNELHFRIHQLVKERGGVPKTGKVKFWRSILSDLQQEGRQRLPRLWQSVRKAYVELTKATAPS